MFWIHFRDRPFPSFPDPQRMQDVFAHGPDRMLLATPILAPVGRLEVYGNSGDATRSPKRILLGHAPLPRMEGHASKGDSLAARMYVRSMYWACSGDLRENVYVFIVTQTNTLRVSSTGGHGSTTESWTRGSMKTALQEKIKRSCTTCSNGTRIDSFYFKAMVRCVPKH